MDIIIHPVFPHRGMLGSTRLIDRGRRAAVPVRWGRSWRFACPRASWRRLLMVDGDTPHATANSASEYPAR
jgi:hypothetical protein